MTKYFDTRMSLEAALIDSEQYRSDKHEHICRNCMLAETTGDDRVYQCSDPDCADIHEYVCMHCAIDGERDLCASAEDYLYGA